MAHSVWTGGSRHTGRAALPHKNIHEKHLLMFEDFQTMKKEDHPTEQKRLRHNRPA